MKLQNYFSTISAPIKYMATLNRCYASNCSSQLYFSITLYSWNILSTSYILNVQFKSIHKKTIARLRYSCTKQSAEDEIPRKECADKTAKNRGLSGHLFILSLGLLSLAFASLECPHV